MVEHEREQIAAERPVRATSARAMPVRRRLAVGAASDPLEREADRVADDVLRSISAAGARSRGFGGGTHTRVERSVRSELREAAPGAGAPEVGLEAGSVSDELAGRIRRAHGHGLPLDERTRSTMEPAFGVDLANVRTAAEGDSDVIDVTRSEPKIQRRDTQFVPFKAAGRAKHNVDVTALALDTLNDHGLRYATGGTAGNDVNLEKMIQDTGGGSAPGEPVEFGRFRMLHQPLVRAHNQVNAATAMHAINHNFANPLLTNLRPENIFLGSARSNTKIHFFLVEKPIRDAMKQATAGAAVTYQASLLAHHPTPSTQDPQILLWNQPGMNLPGAFIHNPPLAGAQAAPLPQATHSIDLDALFDSVAWGGWPKVIQYSVVPHHTYNAWPNFPQFLLDNIASVEQDVVDEQAKLAPNNALIALVQAAIARLKVIGQDLFPEDFTCTAVYWYPSYDPAAPWYQSRDHDIYTAEA